jgi:hypothetical protein
MLSEPSKTAGFNIGSLGVVAAFGMYTIVSSEGVAFGVQLAAVVHDVLTEPFHVSEPASDSSSVSNTALNTFEK